MPDVEGQWDFCPNLKLKIIFFSKWMDCAVSFVKFATLSRSGGTQIPKADFRHLYNHYLHTSTAGTSVTYPYAQKIFHTLTTGPWPPGTPGSTLGYRKKQYDDSLFYWSGDKLWS